MRATRDGCAVATARVASTVFSLKGDNEAASGDRQALNGLGVNAELWGEAC